MFTFNLFLLLLISLAIGLLEGQLLYRAKTTGRKIILNHFSMYHIILLVVFLLLIFLAGYKSYWHILPYMIILQDVSSKLNPELRWFKKGDWALWPFKNFYYFPWWYVALPILFWIIKYILE